ncbi:CHASE domain-containing protein [Actinoplanes sp. NEAU-A11]|uniref:Sensor-like histidine kinase SenX3 n=1 Tax=Actinoplanes aureus TaxID=2792083 RepID=A0A931CF95_9ACTN|nr:CHASE domain-containing protein [Actinoplanes aureus]
MLIAGLVVTALVAAGLHAEQRDKAEQVMDQRHAMALAAVQTEVGRYRAVLETLAAGVSIDAELTWDDFDIASSPLEDAKLIGAAAVGYVVPVRTAEVPAAQRLWRARGAGDMTLRPVGDGEHFFTIYTRLLADTEVASVSGSDLNGLPELTASLREARRIRQTVVSDTYVLLRDRGQPASQQQQSFIFTAPVWTRASTPEFRGWVVLGLRGRSFLSGILGVTSQGQLAGSLIAENTDGSRVVVADWAVPGEPDLTRESRFEVGDHHWTLVTRADTARLPGASGNGPAVALAGGTVLTLLLAWLVYVLATGQARAQAQVEVATDELRTAERVSRRQAGLLGAVLTSISDGVVVVDRTGRVLLHNPAGRRLQGVTEDCDDPREWQRHYGAYRPDGKTPLPLDEMPLIRALRGEPSDGVEVIIRNPGRPEGVLLSIDGRPLDVSAGLHGAVAVFRDITELRRYETDLSIFAGVVAHDLKAPLSVVRGHAEIALEDLPEDADAWQSIQRIMLAVDRMDALIETLLAYTTARHAPLRRTSVDLEPLVHEVIQGRIAHLRADQPVPEWTVGPLPPVEADPAMLRHVLDNLIGNALKYVRPGDVPRVDVTGASVAPDRVRIEVADAGIGIPDAEKPHIFESFHRTEEAAGYAGTGLGLAICRRILERHGGDIGVADNPGGGTRFHFTLPAAVPHEEEPTMTGTDNAPADHDEAVREALDRALAERAAIMDAAQLPGMGGPSIPASEPAEESGLRRHAGAHGRPRRD